MPFAPLISKIRCHSPNRKRSVLANKNYLLYIATREGVDLTKNQNNDELQLLKNVDSRVEEVRKFEDIENESFIYTHSENDDYLRYIAKRPKSHGLFGNIDTSNLDHVANNIAKLTEDGKCIYRGVISLSQKDAETLGYVNKNQWQDYLKRVMPDIANELGISVNHSWVAAFHAEKSHPHVHYELWDNSNKVKSPFIHTSVQNKCRDLLSNAMFDSDYEHMIKEIFKSERDELNAIRNASRREITEITKDIMGTLFDYVPGVNSLPDRISLDEVNTLSNLLSNLSSNLPSKGSVDYAYLQPQLKQQVNNISEILCSRTDMKKEFNKYIDAVEEGQRIIGKTKFEIAISKEKAEKDLYNRIGNIIIKNAKLIRENKTTLENNQSDKLEIHNVKSEFDINNGNDKLLINEHTQSYIDENYNFDEIITLDEEPKSIDYNIYQELNLKPDSINFHSSWTNDYKKALKYLYDEEQQNFGTAHKYLMLEAQKQNALAIHDLAKIYEKGLGVKIDNNVANKYYALALEGFKQIEKNTPHKYIEYRIGKLYETGKGTEKDMINAANWYQKSANNNYKYAQYSLAKLYLSHKGIDTTINNNFPFETEALKLFNLSSDQGNYYATLELAKTYEKGIGTDINLSLSALNYKKAFEGFLKMSLEREDDSLLYRIGKMYYDGCGTDKNLLKAIEYIEKSAKLNNENAQYLLAQIYLKDYNQNENIHKAIEILHNLSNNDNQMAQYSLGKFYSNSESEHYDIEKAINLFQKSASKENHFAQYHLGKLFLEGNKIEQNIEYGLDYLNKSSDQNNEYAQYTLAKFYSNPESDYYDIGNAITYYEKSATQGNQFAQYQLGKLYLEGIDVGQDISKGLNLLSKSSEQGNDFAQYALGKFYSNSESDYYDIEKAVIFYEKSATQGNQFAQLQLGNLYLWGTKVEKNEELGMYWLNKAIEQGNTFALESIRSYQEYQANMLPSISYTLIKSLHNLLSQQYNEQATTNDRRFRSKSKLAAKEEKLRNEVKGGSNEFY